MRILSRNFSISKVNVANGINKKRIERLPRKLPINSLFMESIFFRILLVPNNSIKSKKKLMKKT